MVDGGIEAQTEQCLKNLSALINAAGISQKNIVKTTIYLTDINDFAAVNTIYAEFFTEPYPARTTIAVSALPLGANVEIEVVAKR